MALESVNQPGQPLADGLTLVSSELTDTLNEARQILEDFAEEQLSGEELLRAATLLHAAHGALEIVGVHGAALLADEMEQVVTYLAGQPAGVSRDEGLDALSRSMVQLPLYLDRVLAGGRDIALVLLPLLNDLRAARGKPLLSEGTLLLLNLTADRPDTDGNRPAADAGASRRLAAELRPGYQLALLGLIRGDNSQRNLERLRHAAVQLEEAAASNAVHQLWWVVAGVTDALIDGGLPLSVAVKRLLGQADRQIKRLIDEGEEGLASDPPVELLNNLLYYIARATKSSERVAAIRESFALNDLLPADDEVEAARDSLAAPSAKLMHTVAAAIKEDLARVKDVLDIQVRTGSQDFDDLKSQIDLLKKISDTLGVLGLADLRDEIQAQLEDLNAIVGGETVPEDAKLLRIASALLRVEDHLDDQLVSLISPVSSPSAAPASEADREYQSVTEAVLRESLVELGKVKEAVASAVSDTSRPGVLDSVGAWLRGVAAGLLLLQRERAVRIVEGVAKIIEQRLRRGRGRMTRDQLDRLADALVSVEYFMETLAAGRSEPWYLLDNAEACLRVLTPSAGEAEVVAVPAAPPKPRAAAPAASQPRPVPPAYAAGAEAPDPELLELFIEEAREEIENLARFYPVWAANPADEQALITVRRGFHTLKGSGRMVGAQLIGEFSWHIERLLNRVINQTLARSDQIVWLVQEAIDVLPQLVEQLEVGSTPRADISAMLARVDQLASAEVRPATEEEAGQPQEAEAEPGAAEISAEREGVDVEIPVALPGEAPSTEEAPAQAAEESAGPEPQLAPTFGAEAGPEFAPPAETLAIDPVLKEIFLKETRGHLHEIHRFLDATAEQDPPYRVDEALYRACHTLLGSARMAEVTPAIDAALPMERYVRLLSEHELGMDVAGREATVRAAALMEALLAGLEENRFPDLDISSLEAAFAAPEAAGREAARQQERRRAEETARVAALQEREAAGVEFDPEIAAIFSEEATEILEAADEALGTWRQTLSETAPVVELQRLLHTLKGGARMAGIMAMGDLSHALESLLEAVAEGRLAPSRAQTDALQRSLDELHRMREAASSSAAVTPATSLIEELHELGRRPAAAEEAPPVTAPPPAVERPAPQAPPAAAAPAFEEGPKGEEQPEAGPATAEIELPPAVETEGAAPAEELSEPEEPAQAPSAAPATGTAAGTEAEVQAEPESPETHAESAAFAPETQARPEYVEAEPETAPEEAWRLPAPVEHRPPPAAPRYRREAGSGLEEVGRSRPREVQVGRERPDVTRVDSELLEDLLNSAGEISIFHSRLNQQINTVDFHLSELSQTVTRLREQLRALELETERQILHRHQDERADEGFDPLELDRYSTIQQLSRALAETASDVASINELLHKETAEADGLLAQQGRVTLHLQDGLMRTRMVPFQRHVARLERLVRQAAAEAGKKAELVVEGAAGELDRQILEHMLPPFEHLLRNSVIHGIEPPEQRVAAGKRETGRIRLHIRREGSEVVVEVSDDGAGLDLDRIRARAAEQRLVKPGETLSDEAAMEMVLRPGFSTAGELTQSAGRGVGMDVVANEVQRLGGGLKISSVAGQGARFVIRLPYTLALTQALIVKVGDEVFALPLPTVEGVVRMPRDELLERLKEDAPTFEYGGQQFRLQHLGLYVGGSPSQLPAEEGAVPLILVGAGDRSTAFIIDELMGSREIVVKNLGPQITGIPGVSGATVLSDGSIVIILDAASLLRARKSALPPMPAPPPREDKRLTALVVDDSITVRRVTQRLLERNGMRVLTARDGMDAITVLQDQRPDIILLDIEMPRMDGYQFAIHVRNNPRLKDVPIIMITSRSSEKHRARAIEVGVNDYLSKPYQEAQLLDAIAPLVGREEATYE